MMFDEKHNRAFLDALVTAPDDDPIWGVYADVLEEHGDPMAGFLRHQANLRHLDRDDPRCLFLMRYCPPGTFRMGSPADEPHRYDDEGPVEVTLTTGFWIGAYPVTQREYQAVTGKNPSFCSAEGEGSSRVSGMDTARFPVEQDSWEDAVSFCHAFNDLERRAGRLPEGWQYALPTEAQWEYACRAGTTTAFAFGNILTSHQANFNGQVEMIDLPDDGPYLKRSSRVGEYLPNAWFLYDMHGNVAEWVHDWYSYFLSGGRDPSVPTRGPERVIRGGSWDSSGWGCRSAHRSWIEADVAYDLGGRQVAVRAL